LNRNVTIVVVILVLVVIAGYLVWLRSRIQGPVSPQVEQQVEVTPPPPALETVQPEASPTATPGAKEATPATKQKTATPPATTR